MPWRCLLCEQPENIGKVQRNMVNVISLVRVSQELNWQLFCVWYSYMPTTYVCMYMVRTWSEHADVKEWRYERLQKKLVKRLVQKIVVEGNYDGVLRRIIWYLEKNYQANARKVYSCLIFAEYQNLKDTVTWGRA